MTGILYLIPNTLGDTLIERVLPEEVTKIVSSLTHFAVEDIRTARRFLKKINKEICIDNLHFSILNKETPKTELIDILEPILGGMSMGIISEAGCPGIADPGADLVELAHLKNIRVTPLVGPSSILMAMMASGMNGQSFAFNGYLPIKKNEKSEALKMFENRSFKEHQSQVFIEAPYRNAQLLEDILQICKPSTKLCIACDETLDTEFILTKTIGEWQRQKPDIHKRPAIFIIQA